MSRYVDPIAVERAVIGDRVQLSDLERRAAVRALTRSSLTKAPLPDGSKAEAVFMLIKLDDAEWCACSVGDPYNRAEFLGQLTAYTHGLTIDEAEGWFEDPA